ncbi:glutathione S-transferase family protein [Phanerochaete sordida]|uniref:Glutathione S-transferase family protein n=1 Tax=Phanerochaete sordida TaxID=48140 RepID=A0A9P3GF15_9APHY|nr:glutathione S-transferase family protein [Phanerochaete sordida]
MSQQLTVYVAKSSPFSHRVAIALEMAKAPHTRHEIDLKNKPEWFTSKVNPTGQCPALTYGGPVVPADQPSPESVKLRESLVLVEFIADLYPAAGILPADPVLRAKARLFIDAITQTFSGASHAAIRALMHAGGDPEPLLAALERLQALLPPTGFAIGEFSAADIAIAPQIIRSELSFEHNLIGPSGSQDGQRILALMREPRLARWAEYRKAIQAHPAVRSTFDEEYVLESLKARAVAMRAQGSA